MPGTPTVGPTRANLNPPARQILLELLAEIEAFAELPDDAFGGPDPYPGSMRSLGVPYRPGVWFDGRFSAARRKACSRTVKRLERFGLLHRITQPHCDRVTHLQFTAAGLGLALELAGGDADRAAVADGLRRTAWGKGLADRIPVDRAPRSWEESAEKAARSFGR